MAICDDIIELLRDVSERLARLEEKVEALNIGKFQGAINAQAVNIHQGVIEINESVITELSISTTDVDISSDVENVHINAHGKVDVNGQIAECHVF